MLAGRLSWRALGAGLGGLALAAGLWVGVPRLLADLEFFRVRRVELVGLANLSTNAVLDGLRIPPRLSVFENLEPLRRRANHLPGVAAATVRSRLPGTLVVEITERLPVALVSRPTGLILMDALGRPLPFDPTQAAPDLPIALAPDSGVAKLLGRVRDIDPGLFSRIATAAGQDQDVVLDLDGQRLWFRPDASAEVIRGVLAVAEDLARKGRAVRELDGRFAGQVVVRPVISAPARTQPRRSPRSGAPRRQRRDDA